jgi:hypothetical protein
VSVRLGERARTLAVAVRRRRDVLVIHDFEHLAFDDAAHAVEIGAALPFELARVLRLFLEPKDHPDGRQDDESRQWKKVVPVGEQAIQSETMLAQRGGCTSGEIQSEASQSMGTVGGRVAAHVACAGSTSGQARTASGGSKLPHSTGVSA